MRQRDIFFTFCTIICFQICSSEMVPIIRAEMGTTGFHRDLQYTVEFDYPLAGRDCEYYLKQVFPAGVYINVDQLNDLKRLNKIDALYPKFLDVEIPAEKASPFAVLLHGVPKITDVIKLPIHFRYHGPGKKSFRNVTIIHPHLYMRCVDDDLSTYDDLLQDPATDYCLDNTEFILSEVSKTRSCNWKLLKTAQQENPLVAKIPTGNSESYPPVLYATIIISWVASIWFVFKTHATPSRINHQLEQQRILDKKYK